MNRSPKLMFSLLKGVTRQPTTTTLVRHNSGFPLGKRQFEEMKNWTPTAAVYGMVGFLTLIYFTDWQLVSDYIPFYRGKFHDEE